MKTKSWPVLFEMSAVPIQISCLRANSCPFAVLLPATDFKISLRFDIAGLKSGRADEESREVEGQQDAKGFGDSFPRRGLAIDKYPGAKMVWQEPFLVMLEKRDAVHYKIEEKERQRQNRRRCGLHVEAGEHERQAENG